MHLEAGRPGFEGCGGQPAGQEVDAEVIQQIDGIAAPADRHRRAGHHVFEHQIPTHEPGHEFPERGVAVGVGAASHGHHAGELGVAKAGEHAADAGDDEGDHDGRTGVLSGGQAGEHEDAGADDAADTEGDERRDAQGAYELLALRLLLIVLDGLGGEQSLLVHREFLLCSRCCGHSTLTRRATPPVHGAQAPLSTPRTLLARQRRYLPQVDTRRRPGCRRDRRLPGSATCLRPCPRP